jgi:hypothetical protein
MLMKLLKVLAPEKTMVPVTPLEPTRRFCEAAPLMTPLTVSVEPVSAWSLALAPGRVSGPVISLVPSVPRIRPVDV